MNGNKPSSPYRMETGDIYLEERASVFSILERIQDPDSLWTGIGICYNNGPNSGILTTRNNKVVLLTIADIIKDDSIIACVIRPLNGKFAKQERFLMSEYIQRYYGSPEVIDQITVLSRVFQRLAMSNHPRVKTPAYTYTQSGELRDHRGLTLKPHGGGKPVLTATPYTIVSSILAQAQVFGLIYNPEIELSEFSSGGSMDLYLLAGIPIKFSHHVMQDARLKKFLDVNAHEGAELAKMYYDNHFLTYDFDYGTPIGPEKRNPMEDSTTEVAGYKTRRDPAKLHSDAELMKSQQNRRNVDREKRVKDVSRREEFTYK